MMAFQLSLDLLDNRGLDGCLVILDLDGTGW